MSKRKRRLGLLAAPVVIALALASSAIAGITPLFSATTTADATVVSYAQLPGDDPIAALTFFVPVDYAALLAQPEGETIGTVTASAIAADLANTPLSLKGTIVAASATTTITAGGSIRRTRHRRDGLHRHGNARRLLGAEPLRSGPDAPGSRIRGRRPDHDPAGGDREQHDHDLPAAAGRARRERRGAPSLGAKLVSATLSITDVFSAAPQWYTWHTTVTPYTPGTGKVNAAGTIEVQSVDRTPQVLTTKAKKTAKGKVTVSGRLVAGGKGVSGISVTILAGKKTVGKAVTKAGGVLQQARHRTRDGEVLRLGRRSAAEGRLVLPVLRPCPVRRVVGGRVHGKEHSGEGELGTAQVLTGGRP